MSYIGNSPTQQNFVAGADQFNGTGSQTVFTLSRNVNTVFDIFVAISNVPQDPYNAYSVSGNTLTFTSAPPAGTGNIYVVYRATNVQTFVPSPGSTVGGPFGIQGNLNFYGTGNRITGDFSNGTIANRVMFQTSTVNGATQVRVIPNGTGTLATLQVGNNNDPNNQSVISLAATATTTDINSFANGTGTYLPMTFYTGGSERMRVDTSGNVGIGTSSPAGRLNVESSSGGLPLYVNSTASAQNVRIRLNSTDNASSVSYVMSYSHASLNKQASILLGGTGAVGFYVGQTAGAEPTTGTLAQTIDSSGNLLVGATSSPESARLFSASNTSTTAVPLVLHNTATGTNSLNIAVFYRNSASTGAISTTNNATAYNTSSDYRLKENIAPMTGALAKVALLRPCTYTWKADGSYGEGFIAHELQAVVPDAVSGEKDAVNENGSIKPQGIDTSFLVATLTAALQEQQQMIETLQAEVAALKGAA